MKTRKTNANRSGLLLVLASQALGALLLLDGCTLQVEGGETDPDFAEEDGGPGLSSNPPKSIGRFERDSIAEQLGDAGAAVDASQARPDAAGLEDASTPAVDAGPVDAGRDAGRDAGDAAPDACIPFYNC